IGGGSSSTLAISPNSGFIAKFDAQGGKLWEAHLGTNAFNGIDTLDVDAQGNIFLALRLDPYSEQRSLALVKLSPAGDELWRVVEHGIIQTSDPYTIGSAMKVEASGSVVITSILVR